jgi:hypothetical protein
MHHALQCPPLPKLPASRACILGPVPVQIIRDRVEVEVGQSRTIQIRLPCAASQLEAITQVPFIVGVHDGDGERAQLFRSVGVADDEIR